MTTKTFPEIDRMVIHIQDIIAHLPPKSGHVASLNWIISDLWAFKAGKVPEMRESSDWLYGNESSLHRILTIQEQYIRLLTELANRVTDVSFNEFGVVNNAVKFVMLDLGIHDSRFDCVGARFYNDRILQVNQPGHFIVLHSDKWEQNPNMHWSMCKACLRLTYVNPCDFCRFDRYEERINVQELS
jgi:hypothetical protein